MFHRYSIPKTTIIHSKKHKKAHNNWYSSPRQGRIFFSVQRVESKVCFRGQILFKDHNINPVSEANVIILKCLNNQDNTLEKAMIHISAHTKKIQIGRISKFLIANIIYSYSHRRTSIKLPEMPGKIIAHMATTPQMKVHRHVDVIDNGAFDGEVIQKAKTEKIIKQIRLFQSHFTCVHSIIADIRINHTKKDRIKIG